MNGGFSNVKRFILMLVSFCLCLGAVSCASDGTFDATDAQTDAVSTVTDDAEDTSASDEPEDDIVFDAKATVVNRNGAKGVVTYVIDDGYADTAEYAATMLDRYDSLTFSFALQTKLFATLKTRDDGNGGLEYVKDQNGKYEYTVNENNVEFWQGILDLGRSEIVSHTHTHAFWGTNDDGGKFQYFKTDGTLMTSDVMPKGSSTKELYASKQILSDLFGERAVSFVDAGIGVRTGQSTVSGVTLEGYKTYFNELLKNAIKSGDYIGSRGTFQATSGFENYVNTKATLSVMENRMNVKAFMILNSNAGEDIKNWTGYIDAALAKGGWACFCIHQMTRNSSSAHHILQSQAKQLFQYTDDLGDDVWVARFTDAMLYFSEWSTAKVSAEYGKGAIKVTLTDKEANNSVYCFPLTVKVTVPDQWSSARLGDTVLKIRTDADGSKYVLANIVPDGGAVDIVGSK